MTPAQEERGLLKNALEEIKHLKRQLDRLQEPVAVIGMACRFPGGANTPQQFWQNLCRGEDAVTRGPSRARTIPGEPPLTAYGAYLDDIDGFDARFFGISALEAAEIDPQHRLLLEVAWHALEDAGIDPKSIDGSPTGVYVGQYADDYPQLQLYRGPAETVQAGTSLGLLRGLGAGRIAHCLNLKGPALVTDTSCSSSLSAVHQAIIDLRRGACSLALAGGANLIVSSRMTHGLTRLGALSPAGRCKVFDARADGFVRGEGVGLVVLKRLSEALTDNDPIYAVLNHSVANQDGRSNGLTAPNPVAQKELLAQALKESGTDPERITYVETHGTGTLLGDPIETNALARVLCEGRSPENPLYLGSVKANIGHLEAAAGVAGLIKTILMLHHRKLVPQPHFREPNPHIPWSDYPLRVPDKVLPWPAYHQPALAGLSAFGMTGTNVHILASEAPSGTRDRHSPPLYRFQHRRFWLNTHVDSELSPVEHPLLGLRLDLAAGRTIFFEKRLKTVQPAFLQDHRLLGEIVFPGAAFLEMALAAGKSGLGYTRPTLADITFLRPLTLSEEQTHVLQLTLEPDDAGGAAVHIYSRNDNDWTLHMSGLIEAPVESKPRVPTSSLIEGTTEDHYRRLDELGLNYGPGFRVIKGIRVQGEECWCRVRPPQENGAYILHPVMLDSCFQAVTPLLDHETPVIPFSLETLTLHADPTACSIIRVKRRPSSQDAVIADIRFAHPDGTVAVVIEGLILKPPAHITPGLSPDWFYALHWEPRFPPNRDFAAQIEARSLHIIQKTLRDLGWEWQPGACFTTLELMAKLAVHPDYAPLIRHILSILAEEGLVKPNGDEWMMCRPLSSAEAPPLSSDEPAARILEHFAPALPNILRGAEDPLQHMYMDSIENVAALYSGTTANELVRDELGKTLQRVKGSVHILEIGGGTGGTTADLLPDLPAGTDYWFTDISPFFINRARTLFKTGSNIAFRRFDVEQDPEAQDIPVGFFDIVIAANVLHATEQLGTCLLRIRRLLRPDGRLILLEGTDRRRWVDLTFGLLNGWWKFSGCAYRKQYPLIGCRDWIKVLRDHDFKCIETTVLDDALFPQAVITAAATAIDTCQDTPWIILVDENGLGERVARRLEERGKSTRLVHRYDDSGNIPNNATVLDLRPLNQPDGDVPEACLGAASETLGFMQALRKIPGAKLWLVTRGVHGPGKKTRSLIGAPLWGLGRVFANENPQCRTGMIDLGPVEEVDEAVRLTAALLEPGGENQLLIRDGRIHVPRLIQDKPLRAKPLRKDATYLITGAFGGIGKLLTRHLLAQGIANLVLIGGKNTLAPPIEAPANGNLSIHECDLANRSQLQKIIASVQTTMPPLLGVFHLGGMVADGTLAGQSTGRLQAVFAPKINGAWHLHTLTRQLDLDHFVLFSSSSSLFGHPGMGPSAAANNFLDALARRRRASGLPALSIAWGPWNNIGAAVKGKGGMPSWAGLSSISPQKGLLAFDLLLSHSGPNAACLPMNLPVFLRSHPNNPLLKRLDEDSGTPASSTETFSSRSLAEAPQQRQRPMLKRFLTDLVKEILDPDPDKNSFDDIGFQDMGMDSLATLALRNRLSTTFDCDLPTTLLFDHPTIDSLTTGLLNILGLNQAALESRPSTPTEPVDDLDQFSEDQLLTMLDRQLAQSDQLLKDLS
ncbi:MAG: SDR family NAD(P)-dependent oxidoreductase [Acidobacteriota bacterium]|nr:SDR family NAD(P)-dependent oxidoreductase [Acidobacteriota bacterium]